MAALRPSHRDDFEIAVICALPLEYDAASLLIDDFWDQESYQYGRAAGDDNYYTTGRIGGHNVVFVLLHHMGKASAAGAAASIRSSYSRVRLALLVGICGGMPWAGDHEVLLGDVVISKSVVQYDLGRQYPDKYVRKDTVHDNLVMPTKDVRKLLVTFETAHGLELLQQRTAHFLRELQCRKESYKHKYAYPGTAEDKLFESSYRHKHHSSLSCICSECHGKLDPVCDEALDSVCEDVGCDERYLVLRDRLEAKKQLEQDDIDKVQEPAIHVGSFASGDTVMKSGEDRDKMARKEGIVAFEMEAAGIWEELPCLVVKGVCDFSDCHKNKKWQNFAAATAAATAKAILERYIPTDGSRRRVEEDRPPAHWIVPFGRNKDFIGRESILAELLKRIPPNKDKNDCQRTAIQGLGGVGKTQIALEAAYRVREEHPDCSVFWVPAVDATSFENAFREIGRQLQAKGVYDDKADVKALIKTLLSEERAGSWLLIIDNADDVEIFGETRLSDCLPFSRNGSLLFTTRNREAIAWLDIPTSNLITTIEMRRDEALELLQRNLDESQTRDAESTMDLLGFLADLPLAIKQASAYMAKTGMSTTRYFQHCQSSDENLIKLLSKEFEDRGRYRNIQNPIATTWLISFNLISRDNKRAAWYLEFMCFLAEKDIPASLLPPADQLEMDEAIDTLKAYAFLSGHTKSNSFDMHRLVRLAIRRWLEQEGRLGECITSVIQQLARVFPFPKHENRDTWTKYMPHAQAALDFLEKAHDKEAERKLLFNISQGLYLLAKYEDAERSYRQVLELNKILSGKEDPTTLKNLAVVLRSRRKLKESEEMQLRSLVLNEKTHGKDHLATIANLDELGSVLRLQTKYKAAEQLHRQVLARCRRVLGTEHPQTLSCMKNLANALHSQGRYKEAEQLDRQTVELNRKVHGEEHPSTLTSMDNLGAALQRNGKYDEAEQWHRVALAGLEKALGKTHPTTQKSERTLAKCLKAKQEAGRLEREPDESQSAAPERYN